MMYIQMNNIRVRVIDTGFSFCGGSMRYHYKKPGIYLTMYGTTYSCNHVVYSKCTLFTIHNKGLTIIQQQYNEKTKTTWWGELDPWLIDDIYLNENFKAYFDMYADECDDGLYPTVNVRQIMQALKMKPLHREQWETVFDRRKV